MAGDSTAAVYESARAPRAGWGQALPVFTAPEVEVVDRALSGASSKSFADAGLLDAILRDIEPGDWLLISFGHNDQKLYDPARGVEPYDGYQAYLRTYLAGARQRGAHPVLVTPVERRRFRADGTAYSSLGDYPAAMSALAREENVPLIGLNAASMELWHKLGPEPTKEYFLWLEPGEHPNYPDGITDDTHFQAHGAIEVARLLGSLLDEARVLPRGSLTGLRRPVPDSALVWPAEPPVLT
ncbi:rhamnogalacturonan acetylesterase [Streptomyces sp. YIM 98790]|uniref:rhamnogalacturonan acetylesterase n=1 Tax=Streptomyces sp. YIM 98790 TaxID=2689077 RepID=UPI0028BF2FA5|nr:rhamnogalacturonan acetylesterase [Streptomyces sp. YIM 98790]